MRAILNKTMGPNFRAGDVIHGEYSRISRLVKSGIATADHSITGMVGCVVTWVACAALAIFAISTFWGHGIFDHRVLSPLWRWTLISFSIWISIAAAQQFFTGQKAYTTYYLSFATNIIGGILIMVGHERATSRYQDRRTSGISAIVLYGVGSILFSMALLSILHWNGLEASNHLGVEAFDRITWGHFFFWLLWMVIFFTGYFIARFFNKDFANRRKRFIGFVQRKNVTIEYKTKALNYWRAYKNTGNAEEFMEKNIDLIEKSLDVDRKQLLPEKDTKNKKE